METLIYRTRVTICSRDRKVAWKRKKCGTSQIITTDTLEEEIDRLERDVQYSDQ